MKDKPLISIITSVYSKNDCFLKFLDSISNQTYDNLEVIIIEDHSPDLEILETIEKLENKTLFFNKPLKIIHNSENLGVIKSFQKGLDLATGKYFAFPEADDYVDIDFYEKLIDEMLFKKVNVVKGLLLCHYKDSNRNKIESNVSDGEDINSVIAIKDNKGDIISYVIDDFSYGFFYLFDKNILSKDSNKLNFENVLKYGSCNILYNDYKESVLPLTKSSFYHFNIHGISNHNRSSRLKLLTQTKPVIEQMLKQCNKEIAFNSME